MRRWSVMSAICGGSAMRGRSSSSGMMGVVLLWTLLPGMSALEFTVYRMQQYGLEGRSHEVSDFSMEKWTRALAQSAAAVLILVPAELPAGLTGPEQLFLEREMEILRNETLLPVYFTREDPDLLEMYKESRVVSLSLASSSALEVMIGMVMGSGFQMTTSEVQSKPIKSPSMVTLEGQLSGRGEDAENPTVVVVAHYDAFGAAPFLAYGADSNGSGVSSLLEMIRLFHFLYNTPRSQGRYNILFSLTGGGKFNYMGSKRWIEEHLDHTETSILHENVAFVLCLDTLANGDSLHLHVSRPPAEGTAQWEFMKELQSVVLSPPFLSVNFSVVHKKINLGENILAWEHKQFSLRRLPAFTVSHLDSHKNGLKNTILDTRSRVDVKKLRRNTEILCEALARFLYKDTMKLILSNEKTKRLMDHDVSKAQDSLSSEDEDKAQHQLRRAPGQSVEVASEIPKGQNTPRNVRLFQGDLGVQEERLSAVLDWLTSQPRAAQLITKNHPMLSTMEHLFRRHLKDVRRHIFKPDDRNPEFVFYDQMKQTMTSHRVKPAVFDLFMALVIAAYLGVIHQAVQNFAPVYCRLIQLITKQKKK